MNNLSLRMYFFVPYNISEIQKGIQAGHAALEYAREYGNTKLFKEFANNHKTWIILNGGTTRQYNNDKLEIGTLDEINIQLSKYVPYARFYEPDLNNALTAVCFIADERVWDFEKYPDYDVENNDCNSREYTKWIKSIGGKQNAFLRELIRNKRLA